MRVRVYYWRLHRARDDNGQPISGRTFRDGFRADEEREVAELEVQDVKPEWIMDALVAAGEEPIDLDEIHEHRLEPTTVGRRRPYEALVCECGYAVRADE